jgi:hypothetical protein
LFFFCFEITSLTLFFSLCSCHACPNKFCSAECLEAEDCEDLGIAWEKLVDDIGPDATLALRWHLKNGFSPGMLLFFSPLLRSPPFPLPCASLY